MPFEAIEKSALRQTKRHFTCHDVVADARLFELRVTGIEGLVRVLVDSRDRAAVVEFLPDSASPVMREEGRRVAAEWSLVRAGTADTPGSPDATATTTRWRSEDGHWAASMRYDRQASTPAIVHLSDERALERIFESAPLASLALAMNRLDEWGFATRTVMVPVDASGVLLGASVLGRLF